MAGNVCPKCGRTMDWKHNNGISLLECTCGYMVNVQTGKEYEGFDMSKGQVQANCPNCNQLLNFPAESGVIDGTCPFCDYDFLIDTERGQIWSKVNCPKCGTINSLPPDALIGEYTCRNCSTPVSTRNLQPNYRDKVFHVCPSCGAIMTTSPSDKIIDIRCHACSTIWRFNGETGESAIMGTCSRCGHSDFVPFLGRYFPYVCKHCGKETRMSNPPLTPDERRWLHIVEYSAITQEYRRRIQAYLNRADIRAKFEQGSLIGFEFDFDMRYLVMKPILADGTISDSNVVFDGVTFAQVKRDVQQMRMQQNLTPQQYGEQAALDFDAIPTIVAGMRFAEILIREAANCGPFELQLFDFQIRYSGPVRKAQPQYNAPSYNQPKQNDPAPSYSAPKPNYNPQSSAPQMSADEKMWINKVEQSQITKVYASKLEYLFGKPEFRAVLAKGNIMGYELRVLRTFMLLIPYFTYDLSAHDEQAMYIDYPFGNCAKELRDEANKTPIPPALMEKFLEHEYTAIPYESACDRFAEIMFEHLGKFDYLDLDFKNRMIYTKDCPPKVRVQTKKVSPNAAPPKQKTEEEKFLDVIENSRVIEAIGGAIVGFYNEEGIKNSLRRENIESLALSVSENRVEVLPFRSGGILCGNLRLSYSFAEMKKDIRQNVINEGASREAIMYFDAKEPETILYESAKERIADILFDTYLPKIRYLVLDKKSRNAKVNLGGGAPNHQQNYQAPPQYHAPNYNQQYSQPNYNQQNTYQPPQPKSDEERWVEKVENSRVIEALGEMTINYFNDDRIKNAIRQNNIVKLDLDCGPDGCQMMAVDASGKTTDILDLYEDYSYRQMRQMILNEMAKNGATPQQLVEFEKTEIANVPWKKAQLRVLDILLCDYLAKVPYVTVNPQDYTAQVHLNATGGQQPQYNAPNYNQQYSQPQQPSYQAPQYNAPNYNQQYSQPQQPSYQAPPQQNYNPQPGYQAPEQKKGFFSNMFSSIKQGIDNNKAAEEAECAMIEDNNLTFLAQMSFIDLLMSETSREIYAHPDYKGFYVKGTRYGYEMKLVHSDGSHAREPITASFEKIRENNREEWGDQFVDSCFTELYYASSRKKFVECLLARVGETPYWKADPKNGMITKK